MSKAAIKVSAFKHVVTIKEAPHRRAICETDMRYEVFLNGILFDQIYFNMTGYCGYLPLPDGTKLCLPESGISNYRREVAWINREAKALPAKPETPWRHDGKEWHGKRDEIIGRAKAASAAT